MFNELKAIFENLNYDPENLSHSTTGDGRLDSAESEDGVIEFLIDNLTSSEFQFKTTKIRSWCDVELYYKGEYFPINIKITAGKTADNVSSKKGMFYALTGVDPEIVSGLDHWDSYINALQKYVNHNNCKADYYFLVYFKGEGKFLFTSLKRIETLTPNGNNLPFQCNWGKNKTFTTRTPVEQEKYILETFTQSYIRKAKGLDSLLAWRNKNYE